MDLLPKSSGTRPRVACEISPQGVVAARSADTASALSAVAREELAEGAVLPCLRPGNLVDRVAVVAALRRVLGSVGARPNSRGADITLVIPDTAVRVLLLDFDALPNKLSEALPVVRFRLKKLLPFDAEEAMVTFQVLSSSKTLVRVLAVAIPRDVLGDYETAAREAGYEPGAVLPSTLAALAAVDDTSGPALVVNASRLGVTTAIVRGGNLLLHRSVDLQDRPTATPANMPPALFEPSATAALPLIDREGSAAEWAAQQPLPEHGRSPYADRAMDEAAVQNENGITNIPVPRVFADEEPSAPHAYVGPGDLSRSPYAAGTVTADLSAELHHAVLVAPTSLGTLTGPAAGDEAARFAADVLRTPSPLLDTGGTSADEDIAQAVSVAAAYYEDTLAVAPTRVLSAGPLGASALGRILSAHGIAQADGLTVRELVESSALLSDAVTSSVPRGWLAGVLGALRG